ncbi:hypothetical protein [Anaerotruncus rubiinfantis]|uniref:hypothetical protein n=1 Tax=Anaerotruncus rubiinfantis TaxID=1720200 RepID=UPI000831F565|nr:hypothetical protein [Anaerotruncus rubiinfantis]
MSYHVYLGGLTIYGSETVGVTLARPVTVHNGIGSGEFPIPDDKKLREWTIKGQWTERNDYRLTGWQEAHELLDELMGMLNSDDPERLVIANGYDKTSVLAYLTDVTMSEKYAGVYDFTIKLTEYKKTTVRATGVPTITRPGKIPEMPRTVVFNNTSDVAGFGMGHGSGYDKTMADFKRMEYGDKTENTLLEDSLVNFYQWDGDSGEVKTTSNPNQVPINTPVRIYKYGDFNKWVSNSFDAIKGAYNNWLESWDEKNRKKNQVAGKQ